MTSVRETRGRAEARRLVNNIAKEHGHLGEDVLGKMDQETRREVEEALLKKDLMIGSSVITYVRSHHFKIDLNTSRLGQPKIFIQAMHVSSLNYFKMRTITTTLKHVQVVRLRMCRSRSTLIEL